MTEKEYKELQARLEKYKCAEDRISVLERKKSSIQNGIMLITCAYQRQVDFDYLGDDFKERLVECICYFLDTEIQHIRESMDEI